MSNLYNRFEQFAIGTEYQNFDLFLTERGLKRIKQE